MADLAAMASASGRALQPAANRSHGSKSNYRISNLRFQMVHRVVALFDSRRVGSFGLVDRAAISDRKIN